MNKKKYSPFKTEKRSQKTLITLKNKPKKPKRKESIKEIAVDYDESLKELIERLDPKDLDKAYISYFGGIFLHLIQTDEEYQKDLDKYNKKLAAYNKWFKDNKELIEKEIKRRKEEFVRKRKSFLKKKQKRLRILEEQINKSLNKYKQ